MRIYRQQSQNQKWTRTGAAVAEMAICLPFVFLLTAGAIELSSGLHHQMTIRAAVHECAAHACNGPTTSEDVQSIVQPIMTAMGVTEYEITIDVVQRTVIDPLVLPAAVGQFNIPATGSTTSGLEVVPRGTLLRLRLTADRPPIAGLSPLTQYLDNQVTAECYFIKER